MYEFVKNIVLKTGENAEFGIVQGPDAEWSQRIEHLLGHKGEPWNWQIHKCLQDSTSGVETRCYILSKNGNPFANICTFESNGVGIFGHVFTVPEERKKGAADYLNHQVMNDFTARGGKSLYLGTTYDSPAYHIYRKYGFTSVEPGSGYMIFARGGKESFEKQYFASGQTILEPLTIKHWPILPALTMISHPARIRILSMGIIGAKSTEGASLELLINAEDQNQTVQARVALSERTKAVVAFACLSPDVYFGASADLLDVFWAPGFKNDALNVVKSLPVCNSRSLICYSDSAWQEKDTVLMEAGFKKQGTLQNYLHYDKKHLDVKFWAK
jgi:hypothetical protein